MKDKDQIQVTVIKVTFIKKDTNWHILKTNRCVAKGTIPFAVKEGDCLNLEGRFEVSKFNGEKEFIFNTALLSIPEDPRALLHYAVKITKGLGPSAEEKIWIYYQETWRESDLSEISGISEEVRFHWQDTLKRIQEQKAQSQAISFLLSKGTSLNMAYAAWNAWHEGTISIITGNCYRLAELPFYGFQDVDQGIRQNFGITDNDPRRMDAAVLYLMENLSQSIGSLVDRDSIINDLMKIIPESYKNFDSSVERLSAENKIVVLGSNHFALFADWEHEQTIWEEYCS